MSGMCGDGVLRVERCAVRPHKRRGGLEYFEAEDHITALDAALKAGFRHHELEQGFTLSDGTFATREKAFEVAKAAMQLDEYHSNFKGVSCLFTYMLKGRIGSVPLATVKPWRGRRVYAAAQAAEPEVESPPLPPELAALRPEDPDDNDFVGD